MAVKHVNQRQIVFVDWKFPDKNGLHIHPAIVISDSKLQDDEGMFYAVLVSSADHHSEYTVRLTNNDLNGSDKLDHDSYVVTHFMTYFELRHIDKVMNAFVNVEKFEEIQNKIIKSIMGLDVE